MSDDLSNEGLRIRGIDEVRAVAKADPTVCGLRDQEGLGGGDQYFNQPSQRRFGI